MIHLGGLHTDVELLESRLITELDDRAYPAAARDVVEMLEGEFADQALRAKTATNKPR